MNASQLGVKRSEFRVTYNSVYWKLHLRAGSSSLIGAGNGGSGYLPPPQPKNRKKLGGG